MSLEESKDFDNFYYYGQGNLEQETESDILSLLAQPQRSLYYNRFYESAGIHRFENHPIAIMIQTLLPFAIVDAIAKRNSIISNGESGTDRRVAVSQNLINVKKGASGEMNVQIEYILYSNINARQNISVPLGVGI